MTDYTVSGVAHDPDTDAPLTGLWRVRIYEPITGVHPDELLDEIREGQDVAAYSRPGREASVTLAETTGSQLYWCVFNSDDRQSTIGPLLFTLTEDRTWDDIIANPSPVPSGGGAVSDGVGAVFFGGVGMQVSLDNVPTYCPFILEDDPPRAPSRPDLFTLAEGDDTTAICQRSGLYDFTINTPIRLVNPITVNSGSTELRASVDLEINGGNEPPIYDYNNRAYWVIRPAAKDDPPTSTITLNLTFSQIVLAGDTVQLRFLVVGGGSGVTGHLELNPDITMVATWRGAPPAGLE